MNLARGDRTLEELSRRMGLSVRELQDIADDLRGKGIMPDGPELEVVRTPFVSRLLTILADTPVATSLLAGHGFDILYATMTPKRLEDMIGETGISSDEMDDWMRIATNACCFCEDDGWYTFNGRFRPEWVAMFESYRDTMSCLDPRVSVGTRILKRFGDVVLYESWYDQGHTETGLSYLSQHGLPISTGVGHYRTSEGPVDEDTAFNDAYWTCVAHRNHRMRLYFLMYYVMYGGRLHPCPEAAELLGRIRREKVDGWPSWGSAVDKVRDLCPEVLENGDCMVDGS